MSILSTQLAVSHTFHLPKSMCVSEGNYIRMDEEKVDGIRKVRVDVV
jgi:hypothetical protein